MYVVPFIAQDKTSTDIINAKYTGFFTARLFPLVRCGSVRLTNRTVGHTSDINAPHRHDINRTVGHTSDINAPHRHDI